jgi:hypothetical protein
VDDYYDGGEETDEVVSQFVETWDALKQSILDLGKVMSNSKEILDRFPDEEKALKFREIKAKDSQALPSTKALGVRWVCEEDNFCFLSRADATPPKNLGDVLSQLASTYDPLQTVGPYLMTGKLLLQQFWHKSPSWKLLVSEERQQRWVEWMLGLQEIADLRVRQWYGFPRNIVVTLYACSDTSNNGYEASAYFSAPDHEVAFIAAKGRVINPAKKLSTPRSKLQALVVSCRLVKTIVKETAGVVNVGKFVFWVDSTAVYHWVRNDRNRYVPFVANRLAEVHNVFNELQQFQPEVRYIRTTDNPADLGAHRRRVQAAVQLLDPRSCLPR